MVWLWGLTTALCLSLPLSSPAFLLLSGSGSLLPPPCSQPLHRQWRGCFDHTAVHLFPTRALPGADPAGPISHSLSGLRMWVGQGRDWRGARTYDHGAIRDLLNEALLLQLTDLEVEGSAAARQRQQLPQQQRQGQSGCPRSAPSQPGTGPGPRASCPAGPRHFPRRAGGPLHPACGDCELAHRLQIPGAPARPRPRRVPANPRCGRATRAPSPPARRSRTLSLPYLA